MLFFGGAWGLVESLQMHCRAELLHGGSPDSGCSAAKAKDVDPLTAAGSLTASVTTKLSAVAPEASLHIWPPQAQLWGSWYETVCRWDLKDDQDVPSFYHLSSSLC